MKQRTIIILVAIAVALAAGIAIALTFGFLVPPKQNNVPLALNQSGGGAAATTMTVNSIVVDDIADGHFSLGGFTGFDACNCTKLQIKAGQFTPSGNATVCFSMDHQIGIIFEFEKNYCYSSIEFAVVTDPDLIASEYNAAPGQFPYHYTCPSLTCCPPLGESLPPVYFQGTLPANVYSENLWIAIHQNVLQQVTGTGNTAWTRGDACQEFDTVLKPNGHPYTNRWGAACPVAQGCLDPENPICFYNPPVRVPGTICDKIDGVCVGQHVITCQADNQAVDCSLCNPPEYLDMPCDECPEQCVNVCTPSPPPPPPNPICTAWSAWTDCGVDANSVCTTKRNHTRVCTNCPLCSEFEESSCQCPTCSYTNATMGVCGSRNEDCECSAEWTSECIPNSVPNCACNLGPSMVEVRPCNCTPICSSYRTVTQGGWGSAPTNKGGNPGTLLANNFAAATAPNGFFLIGKVAPYKFLKFTTAKAVELFLPSGGQPAVLAAAATYPDGNGNTPSGSNTFAGQLLAAKINIAMDANVPNFNGNCSEGVLDDLFYNATGCYSGWTISSIIEQADQIISGMTVDDTNTPCDDPSSLTVVLDRFNNNFDSSKPNYYFVECI